MEQSLTTLVRNSCGTSTDILVITLWPFSSVAVDGCQVLLDGAVWYRFVFSAHGAAEW